MHYEVFSVLEGTKELPAKSDSAPAMRPGSLRQAVVQLAQLAQIVQGIGYSSHCCGGDA